MCGTDRLSSAPIKERPDQWLELCRTSGINPQEVQLIYGRYDAYRAFTEQKTGSSLPLAKWFHFYQLEKSSEGLQVNIPAESCLADGDAVNNACLRHPAAFLKALKAYDASQR
ncbi:MAG: hypothetical protein CL797_10185 [Chromatiales bacterium]|jgi:hypothetical protein|nr:hypothetical protein [Chromatiales bacterium]